MVKIFKNKSSFSDEELEHIREYRRKKRLSKISRLRDWWRGSFFNAYIINRRMLRRYGSLVDLISAKLESQPLFHTFFNYGFKMDEKAVFSKEVLIEISGLSDEDIMSRLKENIFERTDEILKEYGLLKYMESSFTKIEEGMGYTKLVVFYKPSGYDILYNGILVYEQRLNDFVKKLVVVLAVILGVIVVGMVAAWIYVRIYFLDILCHI